MKTILVIDDDTPLQQAIERVLKAQGFRVMLAQSGATGLAMATARPPDLILSDVQMEMGDAYSVLEGLRKNLLTATIPVILMTGQPGPEALRRGMDLGADDYLTKPFTNDELLRAIAARFKRNADVRAPGELRYRLLFESADDAIFLMQNGCCVDCNESALRIFRRARDEFIGHCPYSFSPEQQPDGTVSEQSAHERLAAALHGHGQRFEWTHCRTDGTCFETEANLTPLVMANPPLLMAVVRDISERKQAERSAAQYEEQLHRLLERLQNVAEQERTRLSRELHDHMGQLLMALQFELAAVERRVAGLPESKLRSELIEKVSNSKKLAADTHKSVREIAAELRPCALDEDLLLAIRTEASTFQKRMEGIICHLELPEKLPSLTEKHRIHLFRILQESLANVALHARADRVCIRLAKENETLVLQVSDNGVGIAPTVLSRDLSLGLLGMRERAAALGGSVQFDRGRANGTVVTAAVPIQLKPGGASA